MEDLAEKKIHFDICRDGCHCSVLAAMNYRLVAKIEQIGRNGSGTLSVMTTQTIPEYLEEERQKAADTQLRTDEEAARIQPLQHGHHRASKSISKHASKRTAKRTSKSSKQDLPTPVKAAAKKKQKKKGAAAGGKKPRSAAKKAKKIRKR